MHWEPKTELKKHFRMPRYTGVTLSLLSMMVLASMLVVWKKIQPEEENADLRLLVIQELRESIAEISNHFRDEYGYEYLITTFENEEQLEEIIHNRDDKFDLLIASNEYDFRTITETNGTFSEIPICFHSSKLRLDHNATTTMYSAVVPPWARDNKQAFRFARYISAPSKGQYVFAQNQIVGVNGDFWSLEPEITIFTSLENPEEFKKGITTFSEEEGIKSEIQNFSGNKIAAVLKMISQSTATHLLPDLIIADSALSDINQSKYKTFLNNSPNPTPLYFYKYSLSPFPNLCKRLSGYIK